MEFLEARAILTDDSAAETAPAVGTRQHLVVIGNGMAGCRAVEELLARDGARFRVTIFGAEPHVNYNRIMLSPVLAGEKTFDEIVIHGRDWYEINGIELVAGDSVTAIDREARTVTVASGRTVSYDKLLIATGSDPFIIPVPGKDLPGVISFREMKDVDAMLAAAERGGDAVVIGGGLLGLEAAHGLTLRGMKVTVLHLMPTLMERQLDEAAGWLLKSELESRGQTILTGADTAEILGTDHVEGVKLKDGRVIPASLVVMAVGIRPSTALARAAGLAVGRGIQVDDHMVTSDPDVLAVGECVEHDGNVYGLVAPLWDMCRALADGLVDASAEQPDVIIDVATLTGAARAALGERVAPVLGDPDLCRRLVDATAGTGEQMWHMPMPAEMRAVLDSDVADIANARPGQPTGGMIVAAHFLKTFIGRRGDAPDAPQIPWAHLDIAGVANNTGSPFGPIGKGTTGATVRSLIAFAESLAAGPDGSASE